MVEILFFLFIHIILPCALALPFALGDWKIVLMAFAIWMGNLALWILLYALSRPIGEGFSWVMIINMFVGVFAIPLLALILKVCSYILKKIGKHNEDVG